MHSILITQNPLPLSTQPCLLAQVGDVRAGFPSPAEDFTVKPIDLTEVLITHPQATFLIRVRGDSMREAGVMDGDMLVVNRALKPRHGQVVVAVVDGEFTVKYLHQQAGCIKLQAANASFADITPQAGQTLEIWGVVTASITRLAT